MNPSPRYFWQRAALALALLLSIASVLFTGSRAAANGTQPPQQTVVPPTMPASEQALAVQTDADPFPVTATMTDTVMAVAAELNGLPQPLVAPDGALAVTARPAEATDVSTTVHYSRTYLPLVAVRRITTTDPARADVAVTIWPKPSIRVTRGGVLAYDVHVKNYGGGTASSTRVRIPYSRQQMSLIGTSFTPGSGDWVSANETDYLMVTFGALAANTDRTATLTFRTNAALPTDTVINTRASATWSDGRTGGAGATNWAPVLVGAGDANSPYLWLTVTPASGKAGTVHTFFTDRYIPGEGVMGWLNTPAGVKPLDIKATADSSGRVSVNFSTVGRAPGNYSLVLYGLRSNLTAVAGFTVLP